MRARARGGVVHVKDILTRKSDEDELHAKKDDEDKKPLSAHQIEALQILADYVAVGRQLLADNRAATPEQPN